MRYLKLLVLTLLSSGAIAAPFQTTICLLNTDQASHQIKVTDIDNYDWEGNNRPDNNFNNLTIEPGATICHQEDINNNSAPHFTFVIDNNPTRMALYNTAHPAMPTYRWGAYTDPENPTTVYGQFPIWRLASGWLMGAQCNDGPNCLRFELRKGPL